MKRLFSLLLATACILGCVLLYKGWLRAADEAPLVVFISTDEDGLPQGYRRICNRLQTTGADTEVYDRCTDLSAAVQSAVERDATAVIFHIVGNLPDSDFTAAVRNHQIPMIFVGQASARALNTQYDKIWYLGSSTDHAGELIGQAAGEAFRQGILIDADEDLLLDYVVLTDGSTMSQAILDTAAWEYERYGVYGFDCDEPVTTNRAAASAVTEDLTAKGAALAQKPEAIFCVGEEYALAAHSAAAQLGWLEGDTAVYLAAVVESSTAAQTLSDSGSFACIAHYDELAEQQALHTMIDNLLNGQDIAFGTGLRRDMQEPRFDLPYLQFKN